MKRSFIVILLVIFAATAFAGVEWRTKTVTKAQAKGQSNTIVMQVCARGGDVKQIFESVADENEMFQKGSYWLFKAADNSLYMVNPAEKTYSRLPLNAIFQMTGIAAKLIKIKIKNPQVAIEKLANETILGYPCLHRKIVSEYDMEVKVVFIKSKSHERNEKEVWSSTQIKGLTEVAETFRNRDFKTGFEDLDALIAEQMKAEAEAGFPLKTITVTTSIDKKGNAKETMRQTMEVISVGSKNFPASFFEIPSGYEEKQIGLGKEEE
jgi:hypothetical protein